VLQLPAVSLLACLQIEYSIVFCAWANVRGNAMQFKEARQCMFEEAHNAVRGSSLHEMIEHCRSAMLTRCRMWGVDGNMAMYALASMLEAHGIPAVLAGFHCEFQRAPEGLREELLYDSTGILALGPWLGHERAGIPRHLLRSALWTEVACAAWLQSCSIVAT
jgi:hypothetical protein